MHLDRLTLYRLQLASALMSAILLVATLIDPQWIETLFGASPDDGDGSFERVVLGGLFLISAILFALLALRGRRRMAKALAER